LRIVRGARSPAKAAARLDAGRGRPRAPGREHPDRRRRRQRTEAVEELSKLAGRRREWALAQLTRAADAFAEGRDRDALRLLRPLRDAYPGAAGVRELLGLALYRSGQYAAAARELEAYEELTGAVDAHPVLMDCARAARDYEQVDALWTELAAASPSAELVTEGRIVLAGSLADRGRVRDAIARLERRAAPPRHPREHHLRLWYALGDLYERAGDLPLARARFELVRRHAPDFADVAERLAALS
jgi:tetratricopeptide (TPR) repeat protein